MKALKILLLVLLFSFFAVAGSVFILAKSLDKTVLEKDFYEDIMQETNIVELLTRQVYSAIESRSGSASPEQMQKAKIIQDAVRRAITEEWAEKNLLIAIEDFLAYLKGEQEELTAVISLEGRKTIIKENIREELKNQMNNQADSGAISPSARSQAQGQVDRELDKMLNQIPDKIALADLINQSPESEQIKDNISQFQNVYSYFNAVSYTTLIILALLMFIPAGIAGGLKWTGSGMLLSGAIASIVSLALSLMLPIIISNSAQAVNASAVEIFTKPLAGKIYLLSLVYAAIGIILIIAGVVCKKFGFPGKLKQTQAADSQK
ncbi:MAG: hypothetical protein U5L10_03140 [Candidatus Moranbacteria bacterium]|nr:hypothetical protein [Candidatus Moranbacteria bacterium]